MRQLHLHLFPLPVLRDDTLLEALVRGLEALDLGLGRGVGAICGVQTAVWSAFVGKGYNYVKRWLRPECVRACSLVTSYDMLRWPSVASRAWAAYAVCSATRFCTAARTFSATSGLRARGGRLGERALC